jgi:dihydrofolate synthase / folylpolyglutamate synthase
MSPRERLFALEQFGIKLGLDNINKLLDALERPERAWTAIHVAGTNGKGSVTAMVERGLRAAGHRTGRYTSPHLDRIEERIAIDGHPVDAATFDRAAVGVLAISDRLRAHGVLEVSPTFFEVTTAMAFEMFRRHEVSVGVIEVGLGGRFDATNVLTPAVSVITSIALDHERHLGTTLDAIAFEKAGIIKAGIPVVIGELPPAAREVILAEAAKAGATVHTSDGNRFAHVRLGLKGAHQAGNAAVAARTLEVCRDSGIAVSDDHIATGLAEVDWPARLEWLRVGAGRHVLIDAAHNPAGAAALAEYLAAAEVGALPVVVALMKDKDIEGILRALAPRASMFVATQVSSPRALPSIDLAARIARMLPGTRVVPIADPDDAIAEALAHGGRAVVAGSIYLVGPARARLIERGAVPVDQPA